MFSRQLIENGVETFINISTDKAANPISVLGYSKRIAERLTASYDDRAYISVRFGNVLGSQGAFLRIFREQVSRGGPITVTDENVTRYLMTISEGRTTYSSSRSSWQEWRSSGSRYGRTSPKLTTLQREWRPRARPPIEIIYTGLRPGEKLHEELFGDGEVIRPTPHPSISSCAVDPLHPDIGWSLEVNSSADGVRDALRKFARSDKEFAPQDSRS